jgi:hypothetical protein
MSDKLPDPTEAFRNLVTEWERGFDAMANRLMGTEEFSRSMNRFQDLQLGLQKRFNEGMAQQLSNLNLPSRDDILRLGESVRALDKRLTRIEALLVKQSPEAESRPTTRKGPPRTKRAPSERAAGESGGSDG